MVKLFVSSLFYVLYYIKETTEINEDLIRKVIKKGIKRNVRDMLHIPGNIGGVKGIRYTSKKIRKWRDELGVRKAGQYLGHIISSKSIKMDPYYLERVKE